MGKLDTAEAKFLAIFRQRIVTEANKVKSLVGYAESWRMIPLKVEDLLRNAEQILIKAYQLLPDE